MNELWTPRTDYWRIDPDSTESIREALLNPEPYLPYERHYGTLTQEQLLALLRDAKRLHWQVLDLSSCGLEAIPEALGELEELRILTFFSSGWYERGGMNTVSRLPETLGRLTELLGLFLDEPQLTALPASFGALSNLRVLFCAEGRFSALPKSIGMLGNLRELYLQYFTLTELPESIGWLKNLRILDLSGTEISTLPESIGGLEKLERLDLDRTDISTLPESIGGLKNLRTLNLARCHLKRIPNAVLRLGLPFVTDDATKDDCVNLTYATLEEGDIALFSQPREVIEAYYRDRVIEERRECKVILLGDGAAGKSSIIERIVHDRFKPGALPTDGVKMTKWSKYPDGRPLELEGKPLTVRFLDFGGQEIMHSMHRCFLTGHTVYVVVCESRDDAEIDGVAARWMETVKAFAPDCPVLLALNKADLNPNVTVNERRLREINPQFRRMMRTSAKNDGDPGMRQLVEAIFRELPDCMRSMEGNRGFLGLKNELENMAADYLLPEDFGKRCDQLHIDEALRVGLLGWFRDLGVAYTYTTPFRQVYVLNPAWLTNGIYRLILRTESGGFLRHSLIRETLGRTYAGDVNPEKTYSPQEMEFILHVMRKFEISMQVNPGYRDGIEMIPMKMEKTPPPRYDEFQKSGALHLRWEAGYLPNNLVHRLMIRKYPELDPGRSLLEKCVWRTGGWFQSPDGEKEALAEMNDRALDLWVRGTDARAYMDGFRQEILQILRELNIEAKEFVYCSANGRTGKVSYRAALNHYRLGKQELYVEELEDFVSPRELLRENYLDGDEDRDFFISYNNGHDGERARWIAETLRAEGYTVHFQADDCRPGMDFLSWMNEAISHSRGFIAVWSREYEKSYFCQKELNAATVKQKQKKGYLLLPVRAEDVPVEHALFKSVVYVSVFSEDEAVNRKELLRAASGLNRQERFFGGRF